ncbi:P-selectin glycoprotein ligand 1 [Sphaerodactylus townsendi]|uniref:P-selectin glycoprotein ligand 1 n=1 Tax=Sphaerodactylus townsendi TaxID=933632 RepID=UPI002025EC72|nr:P-selectin glycoprotein ligand 1 [Sphaerodactylus townsendi]
MLMCVLACLPQLPTSGPTMPVKHSLMVVLSSLLLAGGYSFPSLRLLFQDGVAGDNGKTRSLRADSLLVATGQWEWKMAGEASRDSTPSPRRKRDVVFPTKSSNESVPETTTLLLLDDETSQPFTPELGENGTLHPGLAGNGSSAEATATPSPLRDASTEVAVARLNTMVHTAPLHGQRTTTSLSEDFTETEGAKHGSRPSSTWSSSVAIPQSVAATISAGTLGPVSKSGVKTTGSTNSSARWPTANSQPIPTVQARPPSQEDSPDPDKMLGQCLLAISLLALVAGVFIITTFVLITLLLRQKRAYKLRQRNHTEMVCISSLLAAEEAEASEGRLPQAKWVKSLAENRSETDMDNLTLNSFLPDH